MATNFLYIVDHYIPFPSSEYGGIWNVIAENDDECFDLITAGDDDFYSEYYTRLRENILQAQKFARQLRGRYNLPVFEVDERYSTTEARSQGATDVDAASACVILDQFLRSLNP